MKNKEIKIELKKIVKKLMSFSPMENDLLPIVYDIKEVMWDVKNKEMKIGLKKVINKLMNFKPIEDDLLPIVFDLKEVIWDIGE